MSAASAPRPALLAAAITAVAILAGLLAAPAALAQFSMPALVSPQVVVGPSSAIDSLNGMSIARDGSGGMVFLETVGGVPQVFVSRLVQGAWQAPEQIDAGLSGPSSQPEIAADNHGELLVAFVNSGALYVSVVMNSSQPFPTPQALAVGASNPSISINTFGVAYLAFTAQAGTGDDVDVDYFDGSSWSAASPQAVNVTAGDNAGTGAGAPDVIAAGDGVGIVTWGENGHIYARRVWGTSTSIDTQQLDPSSVAGWSEVTADSPEISAGGDSSYPDIAFREQVASGTKTQSRVLVARLIAEDTVPAITVDTLGAGSDGAGQPQLAMNEFGAGFVTAATTSGHQLIDTPLAGSGVLGTPTVLAPGGDAAPPDAVPANAGLTSNLIAWQQTPATGSAQILVSYAPNGTDLSAPLVVSTAVGGPTDAAKGLFAGGDRNGDAAVAWVQGHTGALSIDAAELITAPGAAGGQKKVTYTKSNAPLLAWTAARENWGAVAYTVLLDGSTIGQTGTLGWQLPGPLTDGPHSYTVIVTNQASQSSTFLSHTIFVDTYPPVVKTKLSRKPQAGKALTLTLRYRDPPNPAEPGSKASGVASETVNWGDRTAVVTGKKLVRPRHVYRRPGGYTVTVTVTDRAGNATTSTRVLTIKPQAEPKSRRKPQRKPHLKQKPKPTSRSNSEQPHK